MLYSTDAVIFNPVLLEANNPTDQFKAESLAFLQAHTELFFGSSRTKRKRSKQVFEAIEAHPAQLNLSSDMLYAVLANDEIDLELPANQLVLLNLIEKNEAVREFFLRDIFGNNLSDKNKHIKLSGETRLSFEKLSPEVIQANIGLEEYQNYKRNPKEWLKLNKERAEQILQHIATQQVRLISDKAKAAFVSKLSQSIVFAYGFFSRWNMIITPNAQVLRELARINPGAALAILMNPHLSQILKSVLKAEDKIVILRHAVQQTAEYNQKHYFRETLARVLPLNENGEIKLAEFINVAPNPLDLLSDLTRYASANQTLEQQHLLNILTQQAADIVVNVGNKVNASKIAQLMRPYVTGLINNYAEKKRPYQAGQLETLFNDFPNLVEDLHLGNEALNKLSTDDNFLLRNNPDREEHPRMRHPIKSLLNKWFGWFAEAFIKEPNNLKLQVSVVSIEATEESVVPNELTAERELNLTTGPVQLATISDTTEENKSFKGKSKLFHRHVEATLESSETRLEPFLEKFFLMS